MSIINYASREIQFKIVYYGPALCGKTTNLGYIHQRINPQNRGDLAHCSSTFFRSTLWLSRASSPNSSSIPSPVR